jgi:RNA polymerase sigma factor (TIGR02999 family)
MSEVTRILSAIEQGDPHAAEELLPLVYDELRRLAAQKLAHKKPGQTLEATALVHEAYLRLVDTAQAQQWNSRGHFFAAAAEAMRRILIESARRKLRVSHGCGRAQIDLEQPDLMDELASDHFLALDEALERLAKEEKTVAEVHDGGATPSGRPYFVMELIKGVPITEFCDQNQLTPRQRLELFLPVCQAVQPAHQKGIIHRDLKPSNILVTLHDTIPVFKVIDFGIAKALGQELTDKTLFTGFAQLIGTPLYMSPEQAGQSGLDIDTRSDIYSLGVLLYELLTGTTPFDKERLRQGGYEEMRRIIREGEPPRPSTRASGAFDPTFGVGGFNTTGSTLTAYGGVNALVGLTLQPDGKALLVGSEVNTGKFAVARFAGDSPLLAASLPEHGISATIASDQAQPLPAEALSRWQAAGADVAELDAIDIHIADLGGTTLGFASGHAIWLDDNATGWGWFVDPTPWDDSEFTTPGNQGEQNRMDLLTVLEHEIGHLLGYAHKADGVMQETLSAGERRTLHGFDADTFWAFTAVADLITKRDQFGQWL